MSYQLSLYNVIIINCISCGLEFLACAGFTFIPPIMRKTGYDEWITSVVMGGGPLLGFLFISHIGNWSDRCQSKFGRRKPFILILSLLSALCLLALVFHEKLKFLNIICFVVIMFDFCSQTAYTPLDAFIADIGQKSRNTSTLFNVHSLMVGAGGIMGYFISWVDWVSYFKHRFNQETVVFFAAVLIFLLMLTITFISTTDPQVLPLVPNSLEKCSTFSCIFDLYQQPKLLRSLSTWTFHAWCAQHSYTLFLTDYVGEYVFGGNPSPIASLLENELYSEGIRFGSFGLLVHCIVCVIFSLLYERYSHSLNAFTVITNILFFFCVSMTALIIFPSKTTVVFASVFPGLLVSSLLSIPYTVLSLYHENPKKYFHDANGRRTQGIGGDIAILGSMYFLSEFFITALNSLLIYFFKSVVVYIVTSIFFGFMALISVRKVVFSENEKNYSRHILDTPSV